MEACNAEVWQGLFGGGSVRWSHVQIKSILPRSASVLPGRQTKTYGMPKKIRCDVVGYRLIIERREHRQPTMRGRHGNKVVWTAISRFLPFCSRLKESHNDSGKLLNCKTRIELLFAQYKKSRLTDVFEFMGIYNNQSKMIDAAMMDPTDIPLALLESLGASVKFAPPPLTGPSSSSKAVEGHCVGSATRHDKAVQIPL
jgi:hypothetical protein